MQIRSVNYTTILSKSDSPYVDTRTGIKDWYIQSQVNNPDSILKPQTWEEINNNMIIIILHLMHCILDHALTFRKPHITYKVSGLDGGIPIQEYLLNARSAVKEIMKSIEIN